MGWQRLGPDQNECGLGKNRKDTLVADVTSRWVLMEVNGEKRFHIANRRDLG